MGFSTLDELASWMLSNIRLSRYDDQFVNNLTLYTTQHRRITSNQNDLFKKVALKYKRQFGHHKINIEEQLTKPWTVGIVESIPEYTGVNIKIENDTIIFRSPYNKNFLAALRKSPVYSLTWIKEKKHYEAKYSAHVLKQLLYLSADHYEVINYCPIITKLINTLGEYETAKYWSPTLLNSKDYYYVAAINDPLHEAIKDINVNGDLKSIADLVSHGIEIHSDIINKISEVENLDKIKIATNFYSTCEVKNVDSLIDWLHEFGCDAIFEPYTYIASNFSEIAKEKLKSKNIALIKNQADCDQYKKLVVVFSRSMASISNAFAGTHLPKKLFKIIKLVNSEPINIK